MKAALRPLVGRSLRPAAFLHSIACSSSSSSYASSSHASRSRSTCSSSFPSAHAGPSTGLPHLGRLTGVRAYASKPATNDDGWVPVSSSGEVAEEEPYYEEEPVEAKEEQQQENLGPLGDWSGRAAAARRPAVAEHIRQGHKSKRIKLDGKTKSFILDLHRRDPVTYDEWGIRRLYPYMKVRAIRAILAEDGEGFEEDDEAFVAAHSELEAELAEMDEAAYGIGEDLFADVGIVGDEGLVVERDRDDWDSDDENEVLMSRAELERERQAVLQAWKGQGFLSKPVPFDISAPGKPKWSDPGRIKNDRRASEVAFLPYRDGDAATVLDVDAKRALLAGRRPVPPASIGIGPDSRNRHGARSDQADSRYGARSERPTSRGDGRKSSSASFGLQPSTSSSRPARESRESFKEPSTPALVASPFILQLDTIRELQRKREQRAKGPPTGLSGGGRDGATTA